MKMRLSTLLAALQLALPAGAHTLWINLVPDPGKHVLASIGYGDTIPANEILTPDWGPMVIERYEMISPDGVRTSMGVPNLVTHEKQALASGVTFQDGGDVGLRKIGGLAKAAKGTYTVAAQTPALVIIHYKDKTGKEQWSDQAMSKLTDIAQVLDVRIEANYMKAMFTVGAWSDPKPLGDPLEIVPMSDLSQAKAGDVVRFKVLFNGRAWNPDEGDATIIAFNPAHGHRWGLFSELKNGEGMLKLPVAGAWRIDARWKGNNVDIPSYRRIKGPRGEDIPALVESSFFFHVAP